MNAKISLQKKQTGNKSFSVSNKSNTIFATFAASFRQVSELTVRKQFLGGTVVAGGKKIFEMFPEAIAPIRDREKKYSGSK
ncbi:MAG: hypothetical protein JNJ90_03235 [Saprospiraceae bacterium]|jgi:hypothetical protein|nr:hypothetical protein [Saprospiraceae bacterium]